MTTLHIAEGIAKRLPSSHSPQGRTLLQQSQLQVQNTYRAAPAFNVNKKSPCLMGAVHRIPLTTILDIHGRLGRSWTSMVVGKDIRHRPYTVVQQLCYAPYSLETTLDITPICESTNFLPRQCSSETKLIVTPLYKCTHLISSTFVGDNVKHLCRSETTINMRCTTQRPDMG